MATQWRIVKAWQRFWKMMRGQGPDASPNGWKKTRRGWGGEPVFRGTRVPVKSLFDHLSAGDSVEVFLEDFPGVTREQVRAVLDVAGSHLLEEVR